MNLQKIIVAGFLFLSCTTLSAQYNTLSEWYVGPTAGATMSTITLAPKMVDKLYKTGKNRRYIYPLHQ